MCFRIKRKLLSWFSELEAFDDSFSFSTANEICAADHRMDAEHFQGVSRDKAHIQQAHLGIVTASVAGETIVDGVVTTAVGRQAESTSVGPGNRHTQAIERVQRTANVEGA